MNLLQSIISRLTVSAEMLAGVSVSYSRPATGQTVLIDGVLLGKNTEQADTENPDSPRIESSDRDFFIRSARIVLGGQKTEPKSHDRIVILDKDNPDAGKVWEVLPLGGRPFATADTCAVSYRVFTRQV